MGNERQNQVRLSDDTHLQIRKIAAEEHKMHAEIAEELILAGAAQYWKMKEKKASKKK
jgi:hypothetical protein